MQRAIVNRPANVRFVVEDDSGTVLTPDSAPTVVLRDVDGVQVSTGPAVLEADGVTWKYGITRTALEPPMTAHWTALVGAVSYSGSEQIRIVSRRSAPMARLRQDALLASLSARDFTDTVSGAEDSLENALRFRIVTTVDRITVQITKPQRVLRLGPHYIQRVIGASRDGVILNLADIEVRDDAIELPTAGSWDFLTGGATTGTWLPGRYKLDIQHGLVETPADIQRAVRILARHNVPSNGANQFPDRASKIVSAETEIWFSRRGPDNFFGIPEVDDVVAALRLDLPISDNTSF